MAEGQREPITGLHAVQSPPQLPTEASDSDDILSENTRRNSLQAADLVPDAIKETVVDASNGSRSPCRRCSGDGIVPKPCRFCNATGKVRKRSSCIDCDAEKNGCGNTHCASCQGVGRIMSSSDCHTCSGSGKGLALTCGDCGGSGHGTPMSPTSARSTSETSCNSIPEEEA